MKKRIILAITFIVCLFSVLSLFFGKAPQTVPLATQTVKSTTPEPEYYVSVNELHKLVNKERAKRGIKPLILDKRLNKSAQMKVDELEKEGWDDTPHTRSDGRNGWLYVDDIGVRCSTASESLLAFHPNAKSGIDWWMGSKPHRDAILNAQYDLVGYARSDNFVAQHFCDL